MRRAGGSPMMNSLRLAWSEAVQVGRQRPAPWSGTRWSSGPGRPRRRATAARWPWPRPARSRPARRAPAGAARCRPSGPPRGAGAAGTRGRPGGSPPGGPSARTRWSWGVTWPTASAGRPVCPLSAACPDRSHCLRSPVSTARMYHRGPPPTPVAGRWALSCLGGRFRPSFPGSVATPRSVAPARSSGAGPGRVRMAFRRSRDRCRADRR